MDKQQIQSMIESGLLEQYVFGTLDARKVEEIKRLVETQTELQEYVTTLEQILYGLAQESSVAPPAYVKEALMEAVLTRESSGKMHPSTKTWLQYLPWLLLGVSIAGFAWTYHSMGKEQQQRINCQEELALNRPIAESYNNLLNGSHKIKYLTNSVAGFEAIAILESDNQSLTIYPQSLPSLPSGKCYQLWGDKDGKMISVAVIDPSKQTEVTGPLALDKDFTSLNFTIEDLRSDGSGSDHATVANLVASVEI